MIHVALLRGINVGGKNILPMKDLVQMFVKAGASDVRTYIQSGNVIFRANPAKAEKIASLIAKQASVPVVLRTAEELGDIIRHNPFPQEMLHVYFLSSLPNARHVADLDPARSLPDTFSVRGREIYVQLPNGMARTKLTNAYFDSKLATTSTARNWRTVLKLFELIQG